MNKSPMFHNLTLMNAAKPEKRYTDGDFAAWQKETRARLSSLLGMDTLLKNKPEGDTFALEYEKKEAAYIAKKIAGMRIFEDENGKMNLSVQDVGGEVLLVSQFTLYGDATKGNRPSFTLAARPEIAEPLYEYTVKELSSYGVTVKKGVFGADMQIEQNNDGPVTILLEI